MRAEKFLLCNENLTEIVFVFLFISLKLNKFSVFFFFFFFFKFFLKKSQKLFLILTNYKHFFK